jgi:D-glycero-D-manno-heptose 1,7-bisphosphate phosphatase
MMRCIFLDRDGTIVVDRNYSNKIEDIEIIGDPTYELLLLKRLGFYIIVVSNQAGVYYGYHTLEDVEKFNSELSRRLFGLIDDFFFCPHDKTGSCGCRKPKRGLIDKALEKYKIDLSLSYVIGDKSSDVELGKNIGAKTILVLTGHGKKEVKQTDPDFISEDITSALRLIIEQAKREIFPLCLDFHGKKLQGVLDKKIKGNYLKNIPNTSAEKTEKIKIKIDTPIDKGEFEITEVIPTLPTDFIFGLRKNELKMDSESENE